MKSLFVVALCALFALACADGDKYDDIPEGIDVEEILNNDILLKNYANCLDTGVKCTPDGQKIRGHLDEALADNCAKCTQKQKDTIWKIIEHVAKKHPEIYKRIEENHDKDRKFRTNNAKQLAQKGITLPD